MTSDRKWLTVGIGFAICFYIGWYFPVLWLLWVVITLIVLLVPTTRKEPTAASLAVAVSPAQTVPTHGSLNDIEAELRKKLAAASNDDVREGLNQALAVIEQHNGAQAAAIPVEQAPVIVAEMPVSTPAKPLDQTLVLLYIGAFLLLGGMSLFVAYGDLSDQLRITVIALMAAVFYGGGLYLYSSKNSLRPAGVTFVSIGLLMIPLVGFATVYLLDGTSPQIVWLLTSLIALPLYLVALHVTRAQIVGYMAFLMWLSLAESAVNLFDAPIHIFVWVAIGIGIVTQLLISKYATAAEIREPFQWSALVLVPAAVLANFLYFDEGLTEWQFGVSLLLAGLYYAVCVSTTKAADKEKDIYLIASHSAVVLGVLFIAHDITTSAAAFGAVLSVTGLAHVGLWFALRRKLDRFKAYDGIFYALAGLLPLLACGWLFGETGWMVVGLLVALVANICLMLGSLREISVITSVVVGLLLPLAFANLTPGFSNDNILAALGTYYFGAFACFLVARVLRNVYPMFIQGMQVGYGVALGASWILVVASDHYWVQVIFTLLTLGSLVALSAYEKKAELYYLLPPITAVLFGIVFHHIAPQTDTVDVVVYSITIVSAVSYGLSLIIKAARGEALLITSILGGTIAWLVTSAFTSGDHEILFRYFGPTLLAITSLTVLRERKRLNGGKLFGLLPGAGLLIALSQAIYLADSSTDFLVYTHLWTLYGVVATYLVSKRTTNKENTELLTYATLAVFTVPVVFKALAEPEGLYNLLLLFEQTALLVLGVAFRKKLLTYWGAAVVVLSVVYLLRSFAYLQLVLIAVILISYALYRLTRAK